MVALRARKSFGGLALALLLACAALRAFAADAGVVIAAEDDWAPYSSASPRGGDPEGLAVDIVRAAFAMQGVQVRFQVVPFSRCMELTRRGEVTGCFNATIVDDNRDAFVWHPTPMFHEELAIFARTGGGRSALTLADLDGRSVGYTLGYTYPTEFQLNNKIRKVSAKSDGVLLQMLAAGRVDYILLNTAPAYLRLNAMPALKGRIEKVGVVSQDGFWVAFTRADARGGQMAVVFEQGLSALKRSGRYDALMAAFRRRLGP